MIKTEQKGATQLDAELLTRYNTYMRKTEFAPEEIFHICNRGAEKKVLFREQSDYIRFLFLLLYFQSPLNFYNLGRYVSAFVRSRAFNIPRESIEKIANKRLVKVHAFSLMPNHFHILVEEVEENGISTYLHRISSAYAKYFNAKYSGSGHVFQGPFQAVHIKDDDQLLHTSAYIHRNCRKLKKWQNREPLYPWSSFQDYSTKNRWEKLLSSDLLLEHFENREEYKNFVDSSSAKLLDAELLTLKQ